MIPCTVFLGSPPCLRQPPTVTVPTKTQEEWVFNVDELNCQLKLRLVRDLPSFSVVSDRRRYHFHVRLVQTKRMMETIDWGPWDYGNQLGFILDNVDASWKSHTPKPYRKTVRNPQQSSQSSCGAHGTYQLKTAFAARVNSFFLTWKRLTFMSNILCFAT